MDKKQLFLVIGIAILLVGIPVAIILISKPMDFKLGAQNPNSPENVSVTAITAQSASVTWTTPNAVQGGVSYGLSAGSMTFFKPETTQVINHTVPLDGLVAGSKYFYVIKVGGQTYDDAGQPYTFTTAVAKVVSPTPSLSEQGFISAFGTSNPIYDLNKDGVVNTIDLGMFRSDTK